MSAPSSDAAPPHPDAPLRLTDLHGRVLDGDEGLELVTSTLERELWAADAEAFRARCIGGGVTRDSAPDIGGVSEERSNHPPTAPTAPVTISVYAIHSSLEERPVFTDAGSALMKQHVIDLHAYAGITPVMVRIMNYKPSIIIRVPTGVDPMAYEATLRTGLDRMASKTLMTSIDSGRDFVGFEFGRDFDTVLLRAMNSEILSRIAERAPQAYRDAWNRVDDVLSAAPASAPPPATRGGAGGGAGGGRKVHMVNQDILSDPVAVERHYAEQARYPVFYSKDLDAARIHYHFMVEEDLSLCSNLRIDRYEYKTGVEVGSSFRHVLVVDWDAPFASFGEHRGWTPPIVAWKPTDVEPSHYGNAIQLSYDIETMKDLSDATARKISNPTLDGDYIMCIGLSIGRIQRQQPELLICIGLADHPASPSPRCCLLLMPSEEAILRAYTRVMRSTPFAFFIGFNSDEFDNKYIRIRSQQSCLDTELASAFDTYTAGDPMKRVAFPASASFKMDGIIRKNLRRPETDQKVILDTRFQLIKRDPRNLNMAGLKVMLRHFRVRDWTDAPMSKEEMPIAEMYPLWARNVPDGNRDIYVYCMWDAHCAYALLNWTNHFYDLGATSSLTYTTTSDAALVADGAREVQLISVFSRRTGALCFSNVLPPQYQRETLDGIIIGGDVRCFAPGKVSHVISLDFRSQYPTQKEGSNIGCSSLVEQDYIDHPAKYGLVILRSEQIEDMYCDPGDPEQRTRARYWISTRRQYDEALDRGDIPEVPIHSVIDGRVEMDAPDEAAEEPEASEASELHRKDQIHPPIPHHAPPAPSPAHGLARDLCIDAWDAGWTYLVEEFWAESMTQQAAPVAAPRPAEAVPAGPHRTMGPSTREVTKSATIGAAMIANASSDPVVVMVAPSGAKMHGVPVRRRIHFVQSRHRYDPALRHDVIVGTDVYSIQATMLSYLRDERNRLRGLESEYKKRAATLRSTAAATPEEQMQLASAIDRYDALGKSSFAAQDKCKVMMNSEYGTGGNAMFPQYHKSVSAAVTWASRRLVQFLRRVLRAPAHIVPDWAFDARLRGLVANLSHCGVRVTALPTELPDGSRADWTREWRDEEGHTIIGLNLVDERKGVRTSPASPASSTPARQYYRIEMPPAIYQYQDTDSTYYRYPAAAAWLEEDATILDRFSAALPEAWSVYCRVRSERYGEDKMHVVPHPPEMRDYWLLPEVMAASDYLDAALRPRSADPTAPPYFEAGAWVRMLTPFPVETREVPDPTIDKTEREKRMITHLTATAWIQLNARYILFERAVMWKLVEHRQLTEVIVRVMTGRYPIDTSCDGAFLRARYPPLKKQYMGTKSPFEKDSIWKIRATHIRPHLSDWDGTTFVTKFLESRDVKVTGFLVIRRETAPYIVTSLLRSIEATLGSDGSNEYEIIELARRELARSDAETRTCMLSDKREMELEAEIGKMKLYLPSIDAQARRWRSIGAGGDGGTMVMDADISVHSRLVADYYDETKRARATAIEYLESGLAEWRKIKLLPRGQLHDIVMARLGRYSKQQKYQGDSKNDVLAIVNRMNASGCGHLVPPEFSVVRYILVDADGTHRARYECGQPESCGKREMMYLLEELEEVFSGDPAEPLSPTELERLCRYSLNSAHYHQKLARAFSNLMFLEVVTRSSILSTCWESVGDARERSAETDRKEKLLALIAAYDTEAHKPDNPLDRMATKNKNRAFTAITEMAARILTNAMLSYGYHARASTRVVKAVCTAVAQSSGATRAMATAFRDSLDKTTSRDRLSLLMLSGEIDRATRRRADIARAAEQYRKAITPFTTIDARRNIVRVLHAPLVHAAKIGYQDLVRCYSELIAQFGTMSGAMCAMMLSAADKVDAVTADSIVSAIPDEYRAGLGTAIERFKAASLFYRRAYVARLGLADAVKSVLGEKELLED